jgi:HSP20 family protein
MKNKHLPTIFATTNNLDKFKQEFLTPFDSIFNKVFNDSFPYATKELGPNFFEQGSYPKVNVMDHPDRMTIEAAVPGLGGEDVDIEILNHTLTISGSKQIAREEDANVNFVRRELKKSAFQRSFTLGDNLRPEDIKATFENGMLYVDIPKKEPVRVDIEQPQAKKVKISKHK